jgi:hypothetical protein
MDQDAAKRPCLVVERRKGPDAAMSGANVAAARWPLATAAADARASCGPYSYWLPNASHGHSQLRLAQDARESTGPSEVGRESKRQSEVQRESDNTADSLLPALNEGSGGTSTGQTDRDGYAHAYPSTNLSLSFHTTIEWRVASGGGLDTTRLFFSARSGGYERVRPDNDKLSRFAARRMSRRYL